MTTVWIVYTQFTDDPSSIKGIFTTEDKAREVYEKWNDRYKSIIEIQVDKIFDTVIDLN